MTPKKKEPERGGNLDPAHVNQSAEDLMTKATSTRRAVLCAMAAIPVAAVPAIAPAIASASAPINRSEWNAAMAQYKKASAASAAFGRDIERPVFDAWEKAQGKVPHVTTASSFTSVIGGRTHLSTADSAVVAMVRRSENIGGDPEYAAVCRELIEADDARQAELARLRLEFGCEAVAARSNALSDLESAAWHKLMRMHAPDGEALLWKMQELWCDEGDGYCAGWSMDMVELVFADARRLLGMEAV